MKKLLTLLFCLAALICESSDSEEEESMKITLVLLACLALLGCDSDVDPQPGKNLTEDYVYLKDASGRCLRISTMVHVSGLEHSQSGRLRIREITGACENIKEVQP